MSKKNITNRFLTSMESKYFEVIDYSSFKVEDLIRDFYVTCVYSDIDWTNDKEACTVSYLFESACSLVQNTHTRFKGLDNFEKNDFEYFELIMGEMYKLHDEVIGGFKTKIQNSHDYTIYTKIQFINEILKYNKVGTITTLQDNASRKRIFERYSELYSVINLINENFYNLNNKGVSLNSFWYPFVKVCQDQAYVKPLSEEEKLNLFLGLINGNMKFHPVYETHATGYAIKPLDFNERLHKTSTSDFDTPRSFEVSNLSFEKGKQKKIEIETKKD